MTPTHQPRILRTLQRPLLWLALASLGWLSFGCSSKMRQTTKVTKPQQIQRLWSSSLPTDKGQAASEVTELQRYIKQNRQPSLAQVKQLPPQTRALQCKRICQATTGICKSAARICQISQQFPTQVAFQKACAGAKTDCQGSQKTCKSCRP